MTFNFCNVVAGRHAKLFVSTTCKVNGLPEICREHPHARSTPGIGSGLILISSPNADFRFGKAAEIGVSKKPV